MAVILLIGLYKIEKLHIENKNTDISTTIQDEKDQIGEVKLIPQQYAYYIAVISIGAGFFGNLSANYFFQIFSNMDPLELGFYISPLIFLAVFIGVYYLALKKKYPKK